jgi:hypothetical protein
MLRSAVFRPAGLAHVPPGPCRKVQCFTLFRTSMRCCRATPYTFSLSAISVPLFYIETRTAGSVQNGRAGTDLRRDRPHPRFAHFGPEMHLYRMKADTGSGGKRS